MGRRCSRLLPTYDNGSCIDIHCGMLYAMFHTLPTCAMILTQHCSRPSPKRGPAHAAHAHACYNATHGYQTPAICGIGLQRAVSGLQGSGH